MSQSTKHSQAAPMALQQIDTVVVLTLENRSLDYMLGFLYGDDDFLKNPWPSEFTELRRSSR